MKTVASPSVELELRRHGFLAGGGGPCSNRACEEAVAAGFARARFHSKQAGSNSRVQTPRTCRPEGIGSRSRRPSATSLRACLKTRRDSARKPASGLRLGGPRRKKCPFPMAPSTMFSRQPPLCFCAFADRDIVQIRTAEVPMSAAEAGLICPWPRLRLFS